MNHLSSSLARTIASVALALLVTSCGSLFLPTSVIQSSFTPQAITVSTADASVDALQVTFAVPAGAQGGFVESYVVHFVDAAGADLLPGDSSMRSEGLGIRLPPGGTCVTFEGCATNGYDVGTSEQLTLAPMPAPIAQAFVAQGLVQAKANYTWTARLDDGTTVTWTDEVLIVAVP